MTRSLFTLAYPVLSEADRAMVRTFRVEHDRAKVYRVEPHFTIAFGASGIGDDDYLEHVSKIAAATEPITFHCRHAILGADESDESSYVFLVPDEGNSALSLLHHRLYSDALASCPRGDVPYVPHITIGRCSERHKAKELCDDLNARRLSIAGSVEALTVVLMAGDMIKNLRSFELGVAL
jgi:2'-5' RNA ligase